MNDNPKVELFCQLVNGVKKNSNPTRLSEKQAYLTIDQARDCLPIHAMKNVAELHLAALFRVGSH